MKRSLRGQRRQICDRFASEIGVLQAPRIQVAFGVDGILPPALETDDFIVVMRGEEDALARESAVSASKKNLVIAASMKNVGQAGQIARVATIDIQITVFDL